MLLLSEYETAYLMRTRNQALNPFPSASSALPLSGAFPLNPSVSPPLVLGYTQIPNLLRLSFPFPGCLVHLRTTLRWSNEPHVHASKVLINYEGDAGD